MGDALRGLVLTGEERRPRTGILDAREALSSLPCLRALLAFYSPADTPEVKRAKARALAALAEVERSGPAG